MLSFFKFVIALAAALFVSSVPTNAAIKYDFIASRPEYRFVFISPNFVSLPTNVTAAQLTSCTAIELGVPGTCDSILFDNTGADRISFFNTANSQQYFFSSGVFSTLGNHQSFTGIGLNGAQLTISTVAAVPEPDTWLLLIAGFFSVGCIQRRNQRRKWSPLASSNSF